MLLRVKNLSVRYPQQVQAINRLSLELKAGEILGIAGESGSGKSTLARALIGLLPAGCTVSADQMQLGQENLLTLKPESWPRLRGHQLAMVFQDAGSALDPVFRVSQQMVPLFRRLRHVNRQAARSLALESLASMGFKQPEAVFRSYPGELSGGMKQRVLIAMALAGKPQLLLADEPSSALDVSTQAQVLNLLHERVRAEQIGLILISHDLGVIAQYCDRALVMRDGREVEQASVAQLFSAPDAEYTRQLLAAVPRLDP